jgi:hypothetical protein
MQQAFTTPQMNAGYSANFLYSNSSYSPVKQRAKSKLAGKKNLLVFIVVYFTALAVALNAIF